ncbi:hypothetical protein JTB14_014406 [Gonioctena quinquepunctata]|nr:hypothetical protein JTB14_014406 [Gonioctena quinquepunctata]
MEHLIRCAQLEKSDEKQMLLILDGHSTPTKNIEAVKLAREYGIIMLSLPAHTSHHHQPLDKSFFKSSKHHFNEASGGWMRTHPSRVIKQANISELKDKRHLQDLKNVAYGLLTVIRSEKKITLQWRPVQMRKRVIEENDEENDEEISDTVISGSFNTHAESSENRRLKANTEQVEPFDDPQPSTSSCAIIQSNYILDGTI